MKRTARRLAALLTAAVALTASAYSPDYYAPNSRLASGKWVRVEIPESGIYQISHDQLRELGFDIPEQVAVYGYGGTCLTKNTFDRNLPDDVKPTASLHTADGRLLFFGDGAVRVKLSGTDRIEILRNVYSTTGSYFLSDADGWSEVASVPCGEPTGDAKRVFLSVTLEEQEVQNPGEGGSVWHGRALQPGDSEVFTFHVRDFDNSDKSMQKGCFYYSFAARSDERTSLTATWPTTVGYAGSASEAASMTYKVNKLYTTGFGYHNFIKDGQNDLSDTDLTYKLTLPSTSVARYAAVDYAYLIYPRTARLHDDSRLMLYCNSGTQGGSFVVGDATPDTHVWNVSDPTAVYEYSTVYDADDATVTGTFDRSYTSFNTGRIIVFDAASQHPHPSAITPVATQDIHGADTPTLLIITTESLLEQAQQLAEAHRSLQGIDVAVYTQQQVFNEFSSGTRSAMAFRRLAKMLYDRDSSKFKHLLLYGASSWDNRGIIYPGDLLVCYEAELDRWASDSGTNFVADSYFGMLADNYDPANIHAARLDIGVGRIPARDAAKAARFNNKLTSYLKHGVSAEAVAKAVMISDDGNRMSHINQSEEAIAGMTDINGAFTTIKAHNLLYPWENNSATQLRSIVSDALYDGVGYFSYSGHGDPTRFSEQELWSKNAVVTTRYNTYPIAMLATCDALAFDRLNDGIGETMLLTDEGGMIGVVAACRQVYLEYNQSVNLPFATNYASARRGTTLGDIFRDTYNTSKTGTTDMSSMANTLCFNLAGDPAMPIYASEYGILATSILGTDVNADTPDGAVKIKPLETVGITGLVTDGSGNVATSFNGTVSVTLYDAPRIVRTVTKDGSNDAEDFDVTLDETPLARGTGKVVNGVLTASIVCPPTGNIGSANRMTVFAVSDTDNTLRATGFNRYVCVTDIVDGSAPASAPKITELYVDSPDFMPGDRTGSEIVVEACIDPSESGLNFSKTNIERGITLTLDDKRSFPRAMSAADFCDDGTIRLSYPITNLSAGRHKLTLTATNNASLTDMRSIDFVVGTKAAKTVLTVHESPARLQATFDFVSAEPIEHSRLVIVNSEGRTVASVADCTFPYVWNLRTPDSAEVADGRYSAFVVASTPDGGDASSEAVEVVVIR